MKQKYWSPANYIRPKGEVNTLPSMTKPDETLSVKEILTRYGRGLTDDMAKVPMYETDDSDESNEHIQGINTATLDLSERHELFTESKKTVDAVKLAAQKRKEKENMEKHEQAIREKVKKELEEKQAQQKPDTQ